jgi:hypothetical protein
MNEIPARLWEKGQPGLNETRDYGVADPIASRSVKREHTAECRRQFRFKRPLKALPRSV